MTSWLIPFASKPNGVVGALGDGDGLDGDGSGPEADGSGLEGGRLSPEGPGGGALGPGGPEAEALFSTSEGDPDTPAVGGTACVG